MQSSYLATYRINKYEEKLAVMACLSYLCQQIEYHADTCVSSILLIVNVVIQNLDDP